jgi:hypothetical protein
LPDETKAPETQTVAEIQAAEQAAERQRVMATPQADLDREVVEAGIIESKNKLAVLKVQYQLATAGYPGLDHAGTIKKAIEGTVTGLDRLKVLHSNGGEVPLPTKLEVVEKTLITAAPGPPDAPTAG